jgi:hypothetical protein
MARMTRHLRWLAPVALAAVLVAALPSALGRSQRPAPLAGVGSTASAPADPGPAASAGPTPIGIGKPSAAPSGPAVPAATGSGIVPGTVNATSLNLTAEYDVRLTVGFDARSFRVSSTIHVTNTSGIPIDRLELNTIAARLGRMTLTSTRVDGTAVTATVSDQTILLPLGGILAPGASTTVAIAYRATLRGDTAGSNWLFTRANGILEAHRWLPWISRATPFDRPNHGDPFVTPSSPRVRVTIVSDRRVTWATTGEQVGGSGLTRVFEARNVRDFAIAGAPDYRLQSATVGNVVVHVWSRPGFPASTVMAAAKTALSREARLLGAYPYRTYDLAQTAGGYGMESPGLTWIPTGAGNLSYLVAHETGHQWFYGIVGNDQARQPYADEAATDFVARFVLGLRRASRCSTARLDLSIYRYSSACYYEDVYIQGGNFLDDTRKKMGSTAFWAGIRDYLATYRFRLGSTKALLDTLDRHTPLDLVPRYEPRFPGLY